MSKEKLITTISDLYKKIIFQAKTQKEDNRLGRFYDRLYFLKLLNLKKIDTDEIFTEQELTNFSIEGKEGVISTVDNTLTLYLEEKQKNLETLTKKQLEDELKNLQIIDNDYWMINCNTEVIDDEFITIPENMYLDIYHQLTNDSSDNVHLLKKCKPYDIIRNVRLSFSGLSKKHVNHDKKSFMGIEKVYHSTMETFQNPYVNLDFSHTLPSYTEIDGYKESLENPLDYNLDKNEKNIALNFYHLRKRIISEFSEESREQLFKMNSLLVSDISGDWLSKQNPFFLEGIPDYLKYHDHKLFDINMTLKDDIDRLIYKFGDDRCSLDENEHKKSKILEYHQKEKLQSLKKVLIFKYIYPPCITLHDVILRLQKENLQSNNKIIISIVTDGIHIDNLVDIPPFKDNFPLIRSIKSNEFSNSQIQTVQSNSNKTITDTLQYLNNLNTVSGTNLFTLTYLEKTNSIVLFLGDFHTNVARDKETNKDTYNGFCREYEGNTKINRNPKLKDNEIYDSNSSNTFVIDVLKYLLKNTDNLKLFLEFEQFYIGNLEGDGRHRTPMLNEFKSILNLVNYCRLQNDVYTDRLPLDRYYQQKYSEEVKNINKLCRHFYNYTDFRLITHSLRRAQKVNFDINLFFNYIQIYLALFIPEKSKYRNIVTKEKEDAQSGFNNYIEKIFISVQKNICICNDLLNKDKQPILREKLSEMSEDELIEMFNIYNEYEISKELEDRELAELSMSEDDKEREIQTIREWYLENFKAKLGNGIVFKNNKDLLEYYLYYHILYPDLEFKETNTSNKNFNIYPLYLKHPLLQSIGWTFYLLDTTKTNLITRKIANCIFSPFKDLMTYKLFFITIFLFGTHPVFMKNIENLSRDEFLFWLQTNNISNDVIDIFTKGKLKDTELQNIIYNKPQQFDDDGILDIYEIVKNRIEDEQQNKLNTKYPKKPNEDDPIWSDENYMFNPDCIFPENFQNLAITEYVDFFRVEIYNSLLHKIKTEVKAKTTDKQLEYFIKNSNGDFLSVEFETFYEKLTDLFITTLLNFNKKPMDLLNINTDLRKQIYSSLEKSISENMVLRIDSLQYYPWEISPSRIPVTDTVFRLNPINIDKNRYVRIFATDLSGLNVFFLTIENSIIAFKNTQKYKNYIQEYCNYYNHNEHIDISSFIKKFFYNDKLISYEDLKEFIYKLPQLGSNLKNPLIYWSSDDIMSYLKSIKNWETFKNDKQRKGSEYYLWKFLESFDGPELLYIINTVYPEEGRLTIKASGKYTRQYTTIKDEFYIQLMKFIEEKAMALQHHPINDVVSDVRYLQPIFWNLINNLEECKDVSFTKQSMNKCSEYSNITNFNEIDKLLDDIIDPKDIFFNVINEITSTQSEMSQEKFGKHSKEYFQILKDSGFKSTHLEVNLKLICEYYDISYYQSIETILSQYEEMVGNTLNLDNLNLSKIRNIAYYSDDREPNKNYDNTLINLSSSKSYLKKYGKKIECTKYSKQLIKVSNLLKVGLVNYFFIYINSIDYKNYLSSYSSEMLMIDFYSLCRLLYNSGFFNEMISDEDSKDTIKYTNNISVVYGGEGYCSGWERLGPTKKLELYNKDRLKFSNGICDFNTYGHCSSLIYWFRNFFFRNKNLNTYLDERYKAHESYKIMPQPNDESFMYKYTIRNIYNNNDSEYDCVHTKNLDRQQEIMYKDIIDNKLINFSYKIPENYNKVYINILGIYEVLLKRFFMYVETKISPLLKSKKQQNIILYKYIQKVFTDFKNSNFYQLRNLSTYNSLPNDISSLTDIINLLGATKKIDETKINTIIEKYTPEDYVLYLKTIIMDSEIYNYKNLQFITTDLSKNLQSQLTSFLEYTNIIIDDFDEDFLTLLIEELDKRYSTNFHVNLKFILEYRNKSDKILKSQFQERFFNKLRNCNTIDQLQKIATELGIPKKEYVSILSNYMLNYDERKKEIVDVILTIIPQDKMVINEDKAFRSSLDDLYIFYTRSEYFSLDKSKKIELPKINIEDITDLPEDTKYDIIKILYEKQVYLELEDYKQLQEPITQKYLTKKNLLGIKTYEEILENSFNLSTYCVKPLQKEPVEKILTDIRDTIQQTYKTLEELSSVNSEIIVELVSNYFDKKEINTRLRFRIIKEIKNLFSNVELFPKQYIHYFIENTNQSVIKSFNGVLKEIYLKHNYKIPEVMVNNLFIEINYIVQDIHLESKELLTKKYEDIVTKNSKIYVMLLNIIGDMEATQYFDVSYYFKLSDDTTTVKTINFIKDNVITINNPSIKNFSKLDETTVIELLISSKIKEKFYTSKKKPSKEEILNFAKKKLQIRQSNLSLKEQVAEICNKSDIITGWEDYNYLQYIFGYLPYSEILTNMTDLVEILEKISEFINFIRGDGVLTSDKLEIFMNYLHKELLKIDCQQQIVNCNSVKLCNQICKNVETGKDLSEIYKLTFECSKDKKKGTLPFESDISLNYCKVTDKNLELLTDYDIEFIKKLFLKNRYKIGLKFTDFFDGEIQNIGANYSYDINTILEGLKSKFMIEIEDFEVQKGGLPKRGQIFMDFKYFIILNENQYLPNNYILNFPYPYFHYSPEIYLNKGGEEYVIGVRFGFEENTSKSIDNFFYIGLRKDLVK